VEHYELSNQKEAVWDKGRPWGSVEQFVTEVLGINPGGAIGMQSRRESKIVCRLLGTVELGVSLRGKKARLIDEQFGGNSSTLTR